MATASIPTLLPLDTYAEIMAISQCYFNQVYNPAEPYPDACDTVWLQHGYTDQANRIVGREEVARAIAIAEEMITRALGFSPVPVWYIAEPHAWPIPRRGCQVAWPPMQTDWGFVHHGGTRAETVLEAETCVTAYSTDPVTGLLTLDSIATITLVVADAIAGDDMTADEVHVYYNGYLEADGTAAYRPEYEIRPLHVVVTYDAVTLDYTITITGSRCQFVLPDSWDTQDPIDVTDADLFVCEGAVGDDIDIVRVHNDPETQAELVFRDNICRDPLCDTTCYPACLIVDDARPGIVRTQSATYDTTTELWTAAYLATGLPNSVKLWYHAGYPLARNNQMNITLAEAIVHLANTYLPEAPCGCLFTRSRWERDRREMELRSAISAQAMSTFGTTMYGAVRARTLINHMRPIQRAGSL